MDIVICMNQKDFVHKTEKGVTAYWSMGRPPKDFEEGDKIYIVIKYVGFAVTGYVVCKEFNPNDINGETVIWDGDTWTGIYPAIPCEHFRGFRYRWWLKKEEGE